MGLNIQSV